jgi:hypothetical protein
MDGWSELNRVSPGLAAGEFTVAVCSIEPLVHALVLLQNLQNPVLKVLKVSFCMEIDAATVLGAITPLPLNALFRDVRWLG